MTFVNSGTSAMSSLARAAMAFSYAGQSAIQMLITQV